MSVCIIAESDGIEVISGLFHSEWSQAPEVGIAKIIGKVIRIRDFRLIW